MTQKYNVAVAGATGAVGSEIIQILELYGKNKVLNVLETTLLRNEKQIDKKLEYLGELKTKTEKKN